MLVADGRDDRHGTCGDRTHEPFVAEREQVFEASTAAGEHDDVDFGRGADIAQGVDHCGRGERPLHVRLCDDDPCGREPGGNRREDVAFRRGVVPGDEPDASR